ncbi:MAG: LPXTG cell wall anchor domain-containing protein [Tissierellia bacterium]|nr:LPXTG cell wall anchor domain-containing protein [Tissierellia bacterium]
MKKMNNKKIAFLLLMILLINIGGQVFASPLVSSNVNFTVKAKQTTFVKDGRYWNIDVDIENNSYDENDIANNVIVKASITNPDKVFIQGNGVIVDNKQIKPKNYENGTITVQAQGDAESATVPINIDIEFYDATGKLQSYPTQTIYVRLDAPEKPSNPIIEVKQLEMLPLGYVNAGTEFSIGFEVYNPGDATAKNIKLSLDGLAAESIHMANGLSTKDITNLGPKSSQYVFFDLKTAKTNKGGTFPLTLKYNFVAEEGKAPTQGEYGFSIDVKKLDIAPSSVVFENIKFPSGAIGRNKEVNVDFTIKNNGNSPAKNMKISAISTDTSGLVPVSNSSVNVEQLGAGQTASYSFAFKSTNAAQTMSYPVTLMVEYTDDSTTAEAPHKIEQIVGVFVTAPKEVGADGKPVQTSTPKLIIENYSFSPDIIEAGQTFTMYLTLYNTNANKAVKNIKLFLTSEPSINASSENATAAASTSVFTPVESSNTFFIYSIAPGGRIDKEIKLSTVPDTLAKTYTITANFEYEDAKAEKYTATELIGVPVIQKARFEVGELQFSPEFFMGQPNEISVDFYNTGKVTLQNVMVKIDGDFVSDTPSYYKGNFNPGTQDTFSAGITPNAAGELSGKITFSYEDSTGEKQEVVEEFKVNVSDMPDFSEFEGMDGMGMEPPKTGGILTNPIFWIVIVAAAAGGGFVFYKKRKKKREEEDLSLDED